MIIERTPVTEAAIKAFRDGVDPPCSLRDIPRYMEIFKLMKKGANLEFLDGTHIHGNKDKTLKIVEDDPKQIKNNT